MEPLHIVTITVLQAVLPDDDFGPGVILLAESFLSSLRRVVCCVLCSVSLCVFGLGLPCLGV